MPHDPINFDARPKVQEPEKIHLFTLDGKDYFIPATIRPGIALRYLYVLKMNGEQPAVAELLYAVLGDDAMRILGESDQVTQDDINVIMEIVKERALGALEAGNES